MIEAFLYNFSDGLSFSLGLLGLVLGLFLPVLLIGIILVALFVIGALIEGWFEKRKQATKKRK